LTTIQKKIRLRAAPEPKLSLGQAFLSDTKRHVKDRLNASVQVKVCEQTTKNIEDGMQRGYSHHMVSGTMANETMRKYCWILTYQK